LGEIIFGGNYFWEILFLGKFLSKIYMNFLDGNNSYRYFKIISINNKFQYDEGKYKTKCSGNSHPISSFNSLKIFFKDGGIFISLLTLNEKPIA
jgi:hypothetical protein